jgi:hypothetical protein
MFQPLQASNKKYFGTKKRLATFFIKIQQKPEPYDHGIKERNNEHL